ncbi:MAG: hypothetical protein K5663_09195 [Clostridiales bacterium]|nr:hypothetical protein [Clostridiales bacterium]
MKKFSVLALVLVLSLFSAFGEGLDTLGGWSASSDSEVTEERLELFNKALEELVGVDYVPVAYLGSQIVAGQNHCFLARATVVYPGAQPYYALVYIYESLDGQTKIMSIAELDIAGYAQPEEVISKD